MQEATLSGTRLGGWQSLNVPGARWFKADLHIHTIDDLPGGRAGMPDGIEGDVQSSKTLSEYAHKFLQEAVERGVHILGLTPHSPRIGDARGISAVWRIVEEWHNGKDARGVPFRDLIYAIFPGFEPAFRDGKSGLHLLFLFDPEIGRDTFMQAFDQMMDGISPWHRGSRGLRMSGLHAEEALERLKKFHNDSGAQDGGLWDYLVLAPHVESEKGLFGALKGQVLERFPHGMVAGLELGGDRLPDDIINHKRWLRDSMAKYSQWFFHGSDAYQVSEIGRSYTWIKVASPRIEALRQAFVAHHSRMRSGYERGADGTLTEASPPDAPADGRPWLRSVTISGEASFFGSDDGGGRTRFDLSPDLTCIIGGSMTGKSTFLDGLRMHTRAPPPQDPNVREQAEARGRERFLAGSPQVELDCPGGDATAPLREQWPAVFYTQSEIRRLADNAEITKILSGLSSERDHIDKLERALDNLDKDLLRDAGRLGDISDRLADAEQAYERSRQAADEISALSDAGIEDLTRASAETHRWQESAATASRLDGEISSLAETVADADIPHIQGHAAEALRRAGRDETDLHARWDRVLDLLHAAKEEAGAAGSFIRSAAEILKEHEGSIRVRIERRLAERGYDGARINQLHATNTQASLVESYRANLNQARSDLDAAHKSFERRRTERNEIVSQQRDAFDQVTESVLRRFGGRIRAHRIDGGDTEPLDTFIRDLSQRGITRWWNDLADELRPTPDVLLEKAETGRLKDVGMSDAVAGSFLAHLTASRRRRLAALRCRDAYQLEFMIDDGTYRRLADLSGGQQVGLLLSLLLETDDERPLVIDQPEDELDNRFLLETLLPALWGLKGRRQVILATHNANIVVNGDADQVIHLEATANRGRVAHSGAIEEPAVRDAIISTVDGGEEAFRMRKVKYGF